MKVKSLLTTVIACLTTIGLYAQLPLPIRSIGGTQFYYYEVDKGETLYNIAHQLKITESDITKYNPDAATTLVEGQYLFFPVADFANKQSQKPAATVSNESETFTHVVKKGQTIYGIAKNYGITPDDIIKLNPEANAGVKEGQVLEIPQVTNTETAKTTIAVEEAPQDTALIYVTIRPGDTMFSTARRYNTSIDKLMELNPGISPQNFKSGEIIRIRPNYYTAIETERETTEFRTYEVQRGDTYFSLSRRFDVSVDDLKAANPDMKRRLKYGKTLYIPVKKTEKVTVAPTSHMLTEELAHNESPTIQEMYDSIHVFTDDNNINVALMLPLMLNKQEQTQRTKLFTEFYKGFLLAVDTLRQSNPDKSINIYAFDTEDSKSHINTLLGNSSLEDMDIIFTPDNNEHIELIAKYATENKIAVVNSFSVKNDMYNDYPTLFQVNTPQNYLQAKLLDFFDETFIDYEVLFINMPDEEEKEMIGELKAHLDAKNISYTTLDIATSLQADKLSAALMPGKRYVIIPTSSSRHILIKSLDAIKSVKLDRYDVSLCMLGHPEWTTYTAEFGKSFNQVDTYIYSRFFTKHDDPAINDFDEKFYHWYGEYMIYAAPRFGLLGYDTGYYFLSLFMKERDYNNNFNYHGLQNAFDFDRVSNWSGFINKSVYFIHFTVFNTIETSIR